MEGENPEVFRQVCDLSKRSGCYIKSINLADSAHEISFVPLKSIDYHLHIANGLVNVTLNQEYLNPYDRFIEVAYSLPIDPSSCLYRFETQYEGVRIEGKIKEK